MKCANRPNNIFKFSHATAFATLVTLFASLLSACSLPDDVVEKRTAIQYEIDSIDAYHRLAASTFELTTPSANAGSPEQNINDEPGYQVRTPSEINEQVLALLSAATFEQKNFVPDTYASLTIDSEALAGAFNRQVSDKHYFNHDLVSIEVDTLEYSDGSTRSFNKPFSAGKQGYYALELALPNAKSLTAISTKITYPAIVQESVLLTPSTTDAIVNTHAIKLLSLGSHRVELQMPQSLLDTVMVVEAEDLAGLRMRTLGMTSESIPTGLQLEALANQRRFYRRVIDKIDAREFATEAEIDRYLKKNIPNNAVPMAVSKDAQQVLVSYLFPRPAQSLNLVIEILLAPQETNIALKRADSFYFPQNDGFQLATDYDTELDGLIDNDGNWIGSPQYQDLRQHNRYFYSHATHTYDRQYLHLDRQQKRLTPVNYSIDAQPSIKNDTLISIDQESNRQGIVKASSGREILPLQYPHIMRIGAYFSAAVDTRNGRKYLLVNPNGQPHSDTLYQRIEENNGRIHVFTSSLDDREKLIDLGPAL
ncbi:Uncharacterised protein [BD1-7 clade bacterium]|uniref:Lipoprotein n=1 Tax=BD1-7 clade bacterium TaxID=2029982 RepID=A0A5S9QS55_9GAMM|nr:Uncharacterised protein [BD1-7 clade bacterium]